MEGKKLLRCWKIHADGSQNPKDKSATKRKLEYWIELAKLLERGGVNALFLADTYGGYDTYEGKLDDCIRRAAQWPITDPTIVSSHPMPRH
jgi:alkanesulfonate monooxygenase SsuD/methylene tetrahydromethanopterin reductase-like flavin-dependent oxidoreductase (luciferase family)